ncbi:hypothetical protein KUW09_03285 [Mameliella alba]|nr:hypothetical protein [Antarctobacter heliothermus]MBY6143048.1 hypothetical protein [Mameliella alba]MCA0953228.1 hypothetical protein [Mameliella alba]
MVGEQKPGDEPEDARRREALAKYSRSILGGSAVLLTALDARSAAAAPSTNSSNYNGGLWGNHPHGGPPGQVKKFW